MHVLKNSGTRQVLIKPTHEQKKIIPIKMGRTFRNINALPDEIWIEISQYLTTQDLFRLRSCCRKLNERICSRAIWRPICYESWLEHQNNDPFLNDLSDEDEYWHSSKRDWFAYFRLRNRVDNQIIGRLRSLIQETDSDLFWNKFQSMIRFKKFQIIPLLHRIVNKDYRTEEIRFDLITHCQKILISYRHEYVLDLFSNSCQDLEFVHNAEESVFLRLAAMDQSFDKLLHYRREVFDKIHLLIKRDFSQCLNDFLDLPTTLRVDKLICYLIEVLNPFGNERHLFLEDFIILRVYAGEVNGHPLLILSIIQALAARYEVETILCASYLIIRDDRLKDREAYLTISSAGKPKIFTRGRLIHSLKHIVGSSDYIIRNEILPSILQPLKYKELISTIFKELLPLYSKSKWYTVSPKTIESARVIFPHSIQPMSVDVVNYFLCVHKAIEISLKHELQISTLYTITHREVFRLVSRLYPGDLRGIKSYLERDCESFVEPFLSYEDWLHQLHNITLETMDGIGMFVVSSRDLQLMCIVGTREFGNQHTYYTLMNALGEFYVEVDENVEPCDWDCNEDLINDFLKMATYSDLGLVFSSVEKESQRLKVNAMSRRILSNKGQEASALN